MLKSDNGPPFNDSEFAQCAKYLGFKHRKVSPPWPEANGEIECFIETFGKVLHTTTHWKQGMYQFLRNYRATPHCTTGVPLLQPCLEGQSESNCPTLLLCQVVKVMSVTMCRRDAPQELRIKTQAKSRRAVKDCDIQIGDSISQTTKAGKAVNTMSPHPADCN